MLEAGNLAVNKRDVVSAFRFIFPWREAKCKYVTHGLLAFRLPKNGICDSGP